MTDAQNDAADKIIQLMREHFDMGVCALVGIEEDESEKPGRRYVWHGGIEAAIGLTTLAHHALVGIDTQQQI